MKTKKILAIICVISIVFTAMFSTTFADDKKITSVEAECVSVEKGATDVSIKVNLKNNVGIATIGFDIGYNSDVMKLKSVDCGNLFTASEMTPGDISNNPYIVSMLRTSANVVDDGTIVTLNFVLNSDCKDGVYPITVGDGGILGGCFNIAEEAVDVNLVSGSITVGNGSVVTTTETTTAKVTEATTETTTVKVTEATTEITTVKVIEPTTVEKSTEYTTESFTETTTRAKSYSGGGAGASSISVKHYNKSTTEATTEATTKTTTIKVEETSTEQTTALIDVNNVKVVLGETNVLIGDKSYNIDVAPYIQAESNSTLVPLRFVALALSGNDIENADNSTVISWNSETKTATIKANDKIVEFTAGSDTMTVDGKSKLMENGVKAEITDGRMFVPFRALGNALGVDVTWDSTTKTATYSYK